MRTLLLRKRGCAHSDRAEAFARGILPNLTVAESERIGDRLDEDIASGRFEVVLAFRSHIIVKGPLLERARIAVNFHPGPPSRPGIGCVNFALYDGDAEYGCTAHHIVAEIDAGPIIDVRRFGVGPEDDVKSVLDRTYGHMLRQFHDVVRLIAEGRALPSSDERWTRKATRKADLDRLRDIDPGVGPDDLARRIRATDFGAFRPYVVLHGRRFQLVG